MIKLSHNHVSIGVRFSGSYEGINRIATLPIQEFTEQMIELWPHNLPEYTKWLKGNCKEPIWFNDGTGVAMVE